MFKPTSPPHLITLILLTAFSPLSLNMFLPSLAGIASDLGADYALASVAISGYLAVTAVVQLVVGPLSDRIGRRPVLLAALALFVVASLACALAQDIWTFLAFRMLQAGMISGYALSLAIVRDTTSERRTAGLIGYIGMAMALAPMVGPMLGGVLDTAFGWRANFYVYALSGLGLLLLCWVDLGETRPVRRADDGRVSAGMAALIGAPRFWAHALCTAFSTGAFYIFLAGAPLVAASVFGMTTAEIGLGIGSITAGFMTGGFVAGRLAPRVSPVTLMLTGRLVACSGLGFGLIAMTLGMVSPAVFFGGSVFVGLGNGITMPGSNARAMSVFPHLAGSAAGFSGALTVAGGALLTTLTGLALPETGGAGRVLTLMLVASGGGLLAVLWAMRLERSAPVR